LLGVRLVITIKPGVIRNAMTIREIKIGSGHHSSHSSFVACGDNHRDGSGFLSEANRCCCNSATIPIISSGLLHSSHIAHAFASGGSIQSALSHRLLPLTGR
jgi:hypothetical protein